MELFILAVIRKTSTRYTIVIVNISTGVISIFRSATVFVYANIYWYLAYIFHDRPLETFLNKSMIIPAIALF